MAAQAAKRTAQATARAVRAIIAGVKTLISAIIAGGWIAVVIILIIVLLGCAVSIFGGGSRSSTYTPVSAEVEAYDPMIRKYARQYGIPEYVELIKAVMYCCKKWISQRLSLPLLTNYFCWMVYFSEQQILLIMLIFRTPPKVGKPMEKQALLAQWLHEQEIAHIKGWDFSHIRDRYKEEDDLPWDFGNIIKSYLRDTDYLLDMETGGGEFLLSFLANPEHTAAIEGYAPNIKLCEERLLPLGIDFKAADGGDELPFEDDYFDLVTNRHGKYNIQELKRILKSGGMFLTQQVGAENDRDLVELLLGNVELPFPKAYLSIARQEFIDNGFDIIEEAEAYRPIEFYDVGALVWFARIIDWEFPYFEVEKYQENLFRAQKILEQDGVLKGKIHRYYFVARKK